MESQSENKKKNAGALRCYFIEIVVITSAYLIEVVKGNRTAGLLYWYACFCGSRRLQRCLFILKTKMQKQSAICMDLDF